MLYLTNKPLSDANSHLSNKAWLTYPETLLVMYKSSQVRSIAFGADRTIIGIGYEKIWTISVAIFYFAYPHFEVTPLKTGFKSIFSSLMV